MFSCCIYPSVANLAESHPLVPATSCAWGRLAHLLHSLTLDEGLPSCPRYCLPLDDRTTPPPLDVEANHENHRYAYGSRACRRVSAQLARMPVWHPDKPEWTSVQPGYSLYRSSCSLLGLPTFRCPTFQFDSDGFFYSYSTWPSVIMECHKSSDCLRRSFMISSMKTYIPISSVTRCLSDVIGLEDIIWLLLIGKCEDEKGTPLV